VTYLEMCRVAIMNCGVAPFAALNTVLPTVVGATGSVGRVTAWVKDAYSDIVMEHDDWEWLRSSNMLGGGVSFQTIAGQASYPLGTGPGTVGVVADRLGKWAEHTFRDHTTSVGFVNENYLDDIPYDQWRNDYMYGAQRNVKTRPIVIAIGPDLSLNLGPPPNDQYTVTGDYFAVPPDLTADADVPFGLPTRFHMLIVYRTMMKYGQYESAQEVYTRGQEENAGMYSRLQLLRAPRVSWGAALA
jgi:hypothetical protein